VQGREKSPVDDEPHLTGRENAGERKNFFPMIHSLLCFFLVIRKSTLPRFICFPFYENP